MNNNDIYLDDLRELCGHVEDGSAVTLLISQDEATKTWVVKVGNTSYYGGTIGKAVKNALLAEGVWQEGKVQAEVQAKPVWVQEKLLPGRVPEVGVQFCNYCRTGKRIAKGTYCTCSNERCPYPIGRSNEEDEALRRG